jgi:hypothetical protein
LQNPNPEVIASSLVKILYPCCIKKARRSY